MAVKVNLSEFESYRQSVGLYERKEFDPYSQFLRFGHLDTEGYLGKTREYLFFTKPDLHLFYMKSESALNNQICNIPYFIDMLKRYKRILEQLQISLYSSKTPFMTLLSHRIKSSLELPSISSSGNIETSATAYGTSINYKHSTIESDQSFDFSLEFEDSKYLEVYRLLKTYEEYSSRKDLVSPPEPDYYTVNKILHDQFAIYKFIVGEDGESIIYYAKLWGVFPKSVPRETFGNLSEDGTLSYSVDFHANFVDDLDPLILYEFNDLVSGYLPSTGNKEIYNSSLNIVDREAVHMPYIVYDDNPIYFKPKYKLKWR